MELHDFPMHRARFISTPVMGHGVLTHGMMTQDVALPLIHDIVLKTQYDKPQVIIFYTSTQLLHATQNVISWQWEELVT